MAHRRTMAVDGASHGLVIVSIPGRKAKRKGLSQIADVKPFKPFDPDGFHFGLIDPREVLFRFAPARAPAGDGGSEPSSNPFPGGGGGATGGGGGVGYGGGATSGGADHGARSKLQCEPPSAGFLARDGNAHFALLNAFPLGMHSGLLTPFLHQLRPQKMAVDALEVAVA
jgi:hypothetical protein